MNFSTKGEYGLRAVISLAKAYPLKKSLRHISEKEKISPKYLEHLMGNLKEDGIVKGIQGKNGGYVLADDPEKITVGKVIESTEGPIAIKCYGKKCKLVKKCPASFVWIKLGEQIKKTLYGIKLSDLIKKKL